MILNAEQRSILHTYNQFVIKMFTTAAQQGDEPDPVLSMQVNDMMSAMLPMFEMSLIEQHLDQVYGPFDTES